MISINNSFLFFILSFFVLYLNNTNFTRSYTLQYGLSSGIVGICYLPAAAGSMIGGVLGGRMSDNTYNRKASKAQANGMEVYPEMRLGGAIMYGTILLQLFGFIAYGWCLEKNVHFAYGLVCQFISRSDLYKYFYDSTNLCVCRYSWIFAYVSQHCSQCLHD
jgi:hypothetical protein